MYRKIRQTLLFAVLVLASGGCTDHRPEYGKSFDWMVEMFERNDAGFKFYLEEKGADDYRKHTENYRRKIEAADTEQEFLSLANEWLHYFRKGHIGLYRNLAQPLSDAQRNEFEALFPEEETDRDESDFVSYLDRNKDSLDPVEGIWKSSQYTLGIVRSERDKNRFDGFVIATTNPYWFPKQKKVELKPRKNGTFDAVFSEFDHTKTDMTAKLSGNVLSLRKEWIKIHPQTRYSVTDSLVMESLSGKPFLKKIGPKTVYLHIPSFGMEQKPFIDSLLARSDGLIRSTPNLIVDIRNGTGGSDYSYQSLLPYCYTQPTRSPGQLYYATEPNATIYDKYAEKYPSGAEWNRMIAQKMRNSLGNYLPLLPTRFNRSLKPSKYPARVAVLCNRQNASADEGFLYEVRQSYKVKVFGEPTAGMFDFSNVSSFDSPDGKYVLCLTRTVSKRYPDYRIDDIGIQPDFYIDDGIGDWVAYTQSVIEAE